MAVECKHFAGSQRSVTEAAVGNIVERTLSHNCNRYLLITSTIPSSSLAHQIEGINNNPSIPLRANVWSAADIERLVQKYPLVVERFSPERPAKDSVQKPSKRQIKQTVAAARLIIVHLHRDFQDELLELLNAWNDVQKVLKFVPLLPPRELETQLLVDRQLIYPTYIAFVRPFA